MTSDSQKKNSLSALKQSIKLISSSLYGVVISSYFNTGRVSLNGVDWKNVFTDSYAYTEHKTFCRTVEQ